MRLSKPLAYVLMYSLVLFLVFPFLFLIYQFQNLRVPDSAELIWAFKNSFLQALFSALGSVLVGFFMALGLTSFSRLAFPRIRGSLEIICLVPNFLPTLFVLLGVLNAVDSFPMGLLGIAFVHTLINAGLVAVLLAGTIEEKMSAFDELSYIEGASRSLFFRQVLLPLLKMDLVFVGLFVFTICFSSFSVPLIVGGGRGTTLEVLIYEKMRLSNDWGGAVLLAILQSGFIGIISLLLHRRERLFSYKKVNLHLANSLFGVFPIIFATGLVFYGYTQGLLDGGELSTTFYGLQSALVNSAMGTLMIGLSVGFLTYLFLLLITYCWPRLWFEKFLSSYLAPSTALTCFSLLVILPNESFYPFIKIPIAFMMLNLTGLYRLGWDSQLATLKGQHEVALTLGASPQLIFKSVVLPQVVERLGLLSALASVWACGDFAISRILAHRDLTLAMMTETLMSSYRLHQAVVLSLALIILSAGCFVVFVGVSYVLRRKLMS